MKKIFLVTLLFFSMNYLHGDMVYDPVSNGIYSVPLSPTINQDEYVMLLIKCAVLRTRILAFNSMASKQEILQQMQSYLHTLGTPTALRLLDDLKKNKIIYPDGSMATTID